MRALGRFLYWLIGWRFEGPKPEIEKCVMILTPHTSNWDFVVALFARAHIERPVRFLAKHQLFFFPLSLFMRILGGIPVNRKKNNNLVSFCVALFQQEKELLLTIAPEGTRSPVTKWKVGFYHIAKKSNVPIIIMSLDYQKKVIFFSEPFHPSNNMEKDFKFIRDFAKKAEGRHKQSLPEFVPPER